LSFKNSETIIRKVVEDSFQRTAGRRVISIKTAADYVISRRLNVRFYYDQQITKPQLSVPFPTSNTRAGLSLRLTLN
jgi:cell surface protein SprA